MSEPLFTSEDIDLLRASGIPDRDLVRQMEFFRQPPQPVKLERPATLGEGIQSLSDREVERYGQVYDAARRAGRGLKFVPASGAGTRVFKSFHVLPPEELNRESLRRSSGGGNAAAGEVLECMENLPRFPFFDDLKAGLKKRKLDVAGLLKRGQYADIVHFLLDKDGLDLASRPKGLLPLHQYKKEVRTPFEEHLLESLELTRTEGDVCRAHFTVADDYLEEFQWFARKCVPTAEKKHKVKFDLSFSVQKRSTHTLAVDMENRPFRRADGRLLLRPGGHGALIENLNDLNGDIVFIKNIDNAAPARLQGEVVRWKKALGGLLIELQEEIFRLMTWLESRPEDDGVIDQAFRLLLGRLSITVPPSVRQGSRMEHRRFLMSKLNRPLRVCGAVENTGEPGGAPFWVQAKSGEQSIQIVEQHQVDPNSSDQQAIFAEATHFNPVDIVCALRDRTGRPFDLRRHVDPSAVFIAKKSEAGRELKALERPGLWNGGMADWNTVFVEVPAGTFNPFKTLRDLLRDGHRAEI